MIGYRYRNIEWEGAGMANESLREFTNANGVRLTVNNIGSSIFDPDNVSETKPSNERLLSVSSVAYTGKSKTVLSQGTIKSIGGINYNTIPNYAKYISANVRGFSYNAPSVLIPGTRKIRQLLPSLETNCIFIANINFTGTVNDTNNVISGDFTLNTSKFPQLESVYLAHSKFGELKFICNNNKLKYLVLSNGTLTSLSGEMPESLLSLFVDSFQGITSISTLLSKCVNIQALFLGKSAGANASLLVNPTTTLSGSVNLSDKVSLKEFAIGLNPNVTDLILPNHTQWEWVQIIGLSSTAGGNFNKNNIDNFFASPDIRVFSLVNLNITTYSKNIGNADIANSLVSFCFVNSNLNGNVSITDTKPNLREFILGNQSPVNNNTCTQINITGVINARIIDLSGLECEDIELPNNTDCTILRLYGNKLDVTVNNNLLNQVTAMSSLVSLALGQALTTSGGVGQNSVNGLGADLDFSTLVNLSVLSIVNCKVSGTLTLYNANKLLALYVSENASLTDIVNFTAHTSLGTFAAHNCSSLTLGEIPNTFVALAVITGSQWPNLTTIDLSGKTTNTAIILSISSCVLFATLIMPTTQERSLVSSFSIVNCGLTSILNMANINYANTGVSVNNFIANGNALNIPFPFGTNNFIPNNIQIQNNGMSQANVDASIENIYNNADKWDSYATKTLNIAGTNASPSGTYQHSDTPSTGKEMIYYLVNTKGWTITYTV